ncbi:MAG TPA: hypothetical protein PLA54_12170 [Spirochaetota bacterium]|nr:hypothetical protein [Spirochaetota bacterium]
MEKYPVPSFDPIESLERKLHGIRECIEAEVSVKLKKVRAFA